MDRKEFLKKASIASSIIGGLSITSVFAIEFSKDKLEKATELVNLAKISNELNVKFIELVELLKTKKWAAFLNRELSLTLILLAELGEAYTIVVAITN